MMETARSAAPVRVPELRPAEFSWISGFVYERTGIVLKEGKQALVMGRLERRLRSLQLPDYAAYVTLLRQHDQGEEQSVAIDLLTTNETFFFREQQHFDFMKDKVLPLFPGSHTLRIWSAACSSGEEVYSLAMLLDNVRGSAPWEIVGSDISSRVLDAACDGIYPLAAAEKIPPAWLKRYCLRGRDEFEGTLMIEPALRARTRFCSVNLIEPLPDLGSFDVIFLRNVMIYFDQATKRQLLRRLVEKLRPDGFFFVSHAESLNGLDCPLKSIQPSIYRRAE